MDEPMGEPMGEHAVRPTGFPLEGTCARYGPRRPAVHDAARLLELLGARAELDDTIDGLVWGDAPPVGAGVAARDESTDWAESGAMALTGRAGGAPLVAPGAPATAARGAALAIRALTAAMSSAMPSASTVTVDGGRLLGEHAAILGLRRNGDVSPSGGCRLIPAVDGLLAVNLARPDDVDLVGAWLEVDVEGDDPWAAVVAACSTRSGAELTERAQLIGIPVALVPQPRDVVDDEQSRFRHQRFPVAPWRITREHAGVKPREPGLVVDLSSMWAGPLCAHLLGLAGFRVVKVESLSRPDGARRGPAPFYDLLHSGHQSVAFDFGDETDLARLGLLLDSADVVIESSRPRALDHLGLGPETVLSRSPATVWVSITGYGRVGPWRNRVAFGDDAAASAGLIACGADGGPVFCGDAIADPLTGLHGALAALAMYEGGRGGLVDVPLRDVVASTLGGSPNRPAVSVAAHRVGGVWTLATNGEQVAVHEPVARPAAGRAAASGVDTDEVLGALDS
ncbi:MAG: CoA transferase [Acidimicrobiia bacterium]|nr:CoA transferase [Acidimicrobiia bacterium]